MKIKKKTKLCGFTLIELLVVVAIIGIISSIGVVSYNGYTKSAKISVTKTNHKLIQKEIQMVMLSCEINGYAVVKPDYNSDKVYDLDCPFHPAVFVYHIENSYDIKNSYMPTERMTQSGACTQSEIDGLIGYTYLGRSYNNTIRICTCFKKSCNVQGNRLEHVVEIIQ